MEGGGSPNVPRWGRKSLKDTKKVCNEIEKEKYITFLKNVKQFLEKFMKEQRIWPTNALIWKK